jgi:hypothetical protein
MIYALYDEHGVITSTYLPNIEAKIRGNLPVYYDSDNKCIIFRHKDVLISGDGLKISVSAVKNTIEIVCGNYKSFI